MVSFVRAFRGDSRGLPYCAVFKKMALRIALRNSSRALKGLKNVRASFNNLF